jgi:hypothetical protein
VEHVVQYRLTGSGSCFSERCVAGGVWLPALAGRLWLSPTYGSPHA